MTNRFRFHRLQTPVDNDYHPLMRQIIQLFEDVIAPLYGDQTSALEKIRVGWDRTTILLLKMGGTGAEATNDDSSGLVEVSAGSEALGGDEVVAGILVFKTTPETLPATEGGCHRGVPSTEIKTLFVASDFRGFGLGKLLVARAIAEAELVPGASAVHVTVCETVMATQGLLQQFGFINRGVLPNPPERNDDSCELLLVRQHNDIAIPDDDGDTLAGPESLSTAVPPANKERGWVGNLVGRG